MGLLWVDLKKLCGIMSQSVFSMIRLACKIFVAASANGNGDDDNIDPPLHFTLVWLIVACGGPHEWATRMISIVARIQSNQRPRLTWMN